eukprot:8213740-Pyramimonas_sp.AAC.2
MYSLDRETEWTSRSFTRETPCQRGTACHLSWTPRQVPEFYSIGGITETCLFLKQLRRTTWKRFV